MSYKEARHEEENEADPLFFFFFYRYLIIALAFYIYPDDATDIGSAVSNIAARMF